MVAKLPAGQNKSGNLVRGKLLYWTPDCGDKVDDMPFGMLTGPARSQDISLTTSDQLFAMVPFARVNPNIYAWNVPNVTEKQRHAFAIRTCSGCHSAEGSAVGFHVFPRLENVRSQLSNFLTGEHTELNPFKYKDPTSGVVVDGGVHYYADLERRRRWINRLALPDKKPKLYKSLLVPDIINLDEN